MTRVIHTGDTHLGYQQYHRPERREDFLAAFRQVAEDAIREPVDAVIHAGDLFHDRRPTLPDIMGALDVLRTLDDAGVPFLAVVGNHESKRNAQWLDLFESLGLATRLGRDPVVIDDVGFYGLDFVPRSKRDDLPYDFAAHDADHSALVSHGLFQPFPHGDWDAVEVLEESTVEFDAVLLGDDHTPQTRHLEEPHDVWLTYCGSTERASAAERDERGYNLVVFEDGVDIRRRGLDTREFVFVDVELGEHEGIERVRERVGQHDLEDAVVVVKIRGDGEAVTPATIEEYADERGALVARVTDERDIADEGDVDVSFADPDEAVRERIRDLGLSPAARDMDETIRASKVADSNVADEVQDRVATLIDEADPGAFAAAAQSDGSDTDESDEAGESADDREGDQVTMEDYL
jgi:exonuclease SbcD